MPLSKTAIAQDHRLEKQASSASEELARHRWHWTLDENNSRRVSLGAYSRAIGRNLATVRNYARGYEIWVAHGSGPMALTECINRAAMGSEQEAVAEAVAEQRGIGIGEARKSRGTEIRRVREIARDRAEKHGTEVAEEAKKVAEWVVKSERAEASTREGRATRSGLRFIAVEDHLKKAMRALTNALNESHHVDWGDDERDMLRETIGKVRGLLDLVDVSLVGTADIDWDAELAKIAGGAT